jgi:hypothetical protein
LDESDDLITALVGVVTALDRLDIRYYVGGSVASSFHGASRSTMDVDLHCEFADTHVSAFLAALGDQYYASESAIRDAVARQSCFNLIHYQTSFKIDIFVSPGRPFDQEAIRRAQEHELGTGTTIKVPMLSLEDTILVKLEWFRLTNETSERQWDDVTRLVQLSSDSADIDYLEKTAESLGVEDLLAKLINK